MERENNQERVPGFRLSFESGIELLCTRENSEAYLHQDEPQGDHIYHRAEDPEDSMYIFREQIPNFDEIIEYMKSNDFDINERTKLDEQDRKAFRKFKELQFKAQQKAKKAQEKMNNPEPLTQRQERLVGFMAYLLLKEHLAVEDFYGDGELYI